MHERERPTTRRGTTWTAAFTDQLLAAIHDNISRENLADILTKLARDLESAREFESWDPRQLHSVAAKKNYRLVDQIQCGSEVKCLQALPDGRMVVGHKNAQLCVYNKTNAGVWRSDLLSGHERWITCLQALPDGRIISGSMDSTIRIWSNSANGSWGSEVLEHDSCMVYCLQAFPDGSIASGGVEVHRYHPHDESYYPMLSIWRKASDGIWKSAALQGHSGPVNSLNASVSGPLVTGSRGIRIWTEQLDGSWRSEEVAGQREVIHSLHALVDGRIVAGAHGLCIWSRELDGSWEKEVIPGCSDYITCLQALPDGRIIAGNWDGNIRIWSKGANDVWSAEVLRMHEKSVTCLQVLPDGRIVSGSDDHAIRIWDGDVIS